MLTSPEVIKVYGPPLFVPRYTRYPETVDVLATQLKATLCCGAVPVPETEIEVGEVVELLTKAMLPGSDPAVFGAKVTENEAVCPAGIVNGNVMPLSE